MKIGNLILTVVVFAIAYTIQLSAQSSAEGSDVHLPGAGVTTVTVVTGIPFATAVELSLGISDNFTASAFTGITLTGAPAVGARPRVAIATLSESVRIDGRLPVVFYPATDTLEAWALAWPSVDLRASFGPIQLSAGVGMVGTVCTDALFNTGAHGDAHASHAGHTSEQHAHHQEPEHEDALMGSLSPTMQLEAAIDISNRITLRTDLYGIAPASIAGETWPGRLPVVVNLGMTWWLGGRDAAGD